MSEAVKTSLLSLDALLSAVNGTIAGTERSDFGFSYVVTDSRFVSAGAMFVPLIGETQNGHKYIPQAIDAGATVVLANKSDYEQNNSFYKELESAGKLAAITLILVENTLYALQAAAKAYAQKVAQNMIRVSITGSSGKTTTKEMLVSVCKKHFGDDAVAYTKGNFNSETGLPLSMFQIKGDEKIGIFEMGMNRKNEIGEISNVWQSQYGIITNIGTAHIGILGSRQNIAEEKRKSFDYIPQTGAVFVPVDDDFADFCTEKVRGKVVKFGRTVSSGQNGVTFIEDLGLNGTKFSVDGVEITLPLAGEYNYQNALGVIALAKEIGISAQEIKAGLEGVAAISGRMDIKQITLKNGAKVNAVCDFYNANLDSMEKVIDFCSKQSNFEQKIFVLADMKELGAASFKSHTQIGKDIAATDATLVILAGPEMKAACDILEREKDVAGRNVLYFENNDDAFYEAAASKILAFVKSDALILFKGSHSMALEKLLPLIQEAE
ncbi:MAG: UDP-N-acetylmuramoyl-tripeptide--D-alanyl-D-alanine ligase [Treponema sp.]|nr:UDP-N-acetylmuramoyl-tripeptide--D-alanyl-D-alanine ligase [Treponema sp.]